MTALAVFTFQFIGIFCRCYQTQNVMGRHYISAALTSLALGIAGLITLYGLIDTRIDGGSVIVTAAYLSAGPCGAVAAIWAHPKLRRK